VVGSRTRRRPRFPPSAALPASPPESALLLLRSVAGEAARFEEHAHALDVPSPDNARTPAISKSIA